MSKYTPTVEEVETNWTKVYHKGAGNLHLYMPPEASLPPHGKVEGYRIARSLNGTMVWPAEAWAEELTLTPPSLSNLPKPEK